jgi:regulator of sigma E protease
MSESKPSVQINFRVLLLVILVAAAIILIGRNLSVSGSIVVVVLGFGGVVVIHEFGHFIVAKLSDIKVEAFSIFMPPTLIGIKKTEKGFRFRILPRFFPKEQDQTNDEEDGLQFTVGKPGKTGETEYRIGLIPLGGFVKMLGQDDAGPVTTSDDPRSFTNKPVSKRMAVIAAGVVFNALSAVAAFMVIFLVGIKLPPPVVGWVAPDSPAAHAGLQPGDEFIEIDGKTKDLDFSNILVAAALSGKDEQIEMKVKRGDRILDIAMASIEEKGQDLRVFGIEQPLSLEIAQFAEANDVKMFEEETGLKPKDRVTAIDGKPVQAHWELRRILQDTDAPSITLTAQRSDKAGTKTRVDSKKIRLVWSASQVPDVESESELDHVYTMVPRLRVAAVAREQHLERVESTDSVLKNGDIILAMGDVENPTFKELRDVTAENENKKVPITVLRKNAEGVEGTVTLVVTPKTDTGGDKPTIGILPVLDAENAVVAGTINTEAREALPIPRGAVIEFVDGTPVSNFYDIIREIRKRAGQRITLDYRVDSEEAGDVVLNVGSAEEPVGVFPTLEKSVPFDDLKRLYKAVGPLDAVAKGYRKTVMFIAQTYVTLRRVVGGLVSPRNLMGPVGILHASYKIVSDQPLVNYVYLLALISACIAVVNILPLPPFDGGLIMILAIEKIRGSALSERVQGAIAYAGVALLVALFLYLTFNDIFRILFR